MRSVVLALIIALPLVGPAMAAGGAPAGELVIFPTQARVEVDSQGKVVGVKPDPALSLAVGQAIQAAVGAWRFAPPLKDGHAVGGVTFMQLTACAAPVAPGGNYRFSVESRGNGPARSGPPAPQFPAGLMRRSVSAKLQLNYRVLADGTAQIEDIALVEGSKKWVGAFRETIQDWIRASRFEPEQLDGVPVTTKMSMPIEFSTGGRSFSLAAAERKEQKRMRAWAAEQGSCKAVSAPATQDDREMALDSPFHLLPRG